MYYIDPGSSSVPLQILAAGLLGILFGFKRAIFSVLGKLRRVFPARPK